MKKAIAYFILTVICAIIGIEVAKWIWSLDIPEWLKVMLIAN